MALTEMASAQFPQDWALRLASLSTVREISLFRFPVTAFGRSAPPVLSARWRVMAQPVAEAMDR